MKAQQFTIGRFLSLLICTIAAASVSFAAGVPDVGFGLAGAARSAVADQSRIVDVVFSPDGRMTVVLPNDDGTTALMRFLPNGASDATFNSRGVLTLDTSSMIIQDALMQPDGRLLLAGGCHPTEMPATTDFCIDRLMPDGSPDLTFGVDGRFSLNQGSNDVINSIALMADGRIVAAGYSSDSDDTNAVLRILPNGISDPSLDLARFSFPPYPHAGVSQLQQIRVLDDGRLLVGASMHVSHVTGSGIGYALAMLSPGGQLDPAFGSNGTAMAARTTPSGHPTGMSVEVMPSGNIFVAHGSGASMLTSSGSFISYLPLEAQRSELLPGGRILAWGDGLDSGSEAGPIKIYSETGLIGKSALKGYPFATPDGRIIVASIDQGRSEVVLQSLLRLTSQGTRIVDFDRDDRSDFAVMQGMFLYSQNSSGSLIDGLQTFDHEQVIPELSEQRKTNGEVDRSTVVIARRGTSSSPGSFGRISWLDPGTKYFSTEYGLAGDIPTGGDFDGDGMVNMTVFRPADGNWYPMVGEAGQNGTVHWGAAGDKPVPADYDYDGKTDFAIYRPSNGTWWILRSSDGGVSAAQFGISTDIPLTGDFDGDGYADLSVYRPSEGMWYQQLTTEGFKAVRFGLPTDIPVPGDYDGDGRHDIAVYRDGIWYLLRSTAGFTSVTPSFAAPGEVPVAVRYDQ